MKNAITGFVGNFPVLVLILALATSCKNEDQTEIASDNETNASVTISSNNLSKVSKINSKDSLNWQKKTIEAKTNYPGFGSAPSKIEIEIY